MRKKPSKEVFLIGKNENILESIRRQTSVFSVDCNGLGTCGKCKILMDKPLSLNSIEKDRLTTLEIQQGIRLACQQPLPTQAIEVQLVDNTGDYQISGVKQKAFKITEPEEGIGVAVDIGTTTVVLAFVDLTTGKVIEERRVLNPQRIYGAEVLSRIDAANKYGKELLSEVIRITIQEEIADFNKTYDKSLLKIVICGNTTMTHLLMNEEVSGIGQFPFDYPIKQLKVLSATIFNLKEEIPVYILPAFAAYVGADILCGVDYLSLREKAGNYLLLDLGTNGEIVLAKDGELTVSSTAAGPAFEGANMKDGCGAMAGAIIDIVDGQLHTINNQKAIGICGSGYINLIAFYLGNGRLEKNGYLAGKKIDLTAGLALYQEDIRNFQLAKSAIRCGIDLLLQQQKLEYSDITEVYLAGGFSEGIRLDSYLGIGIFPLAFKDKIKVVGNSALAVVIKIMLGMDFVEVRKLQKIAKVVDLASTEDFIDCFSKQMSLEVG